MTNFTLLYPSMTLAAAFDQAEAIVSGKTRKEIESDLSSAFRALIRQLDVERFAEPTGESDRWYWAAPVLLDKLSADHGPTADHWLHSNQIRQTSFWTEQEAKDTSKSIHFQRLIRAFDSPDELGLGPMPDELPDVLAETALGSPAVAAFRSLQRIYGGEIQSNCILAVSVADEFVNLFNKPESIAAVRISLGERLPYWRKTLRYCRDGCLQAVIDEYLHLLKAECETADAAVTHFNGSLRFRTNSIKVDDLNTFVNDERKNMRCHFAVDFGNQRLDTEQGGERAGSVRQTFNSPFRPFVLATTSIGQEGLDFHQYCRKVVHWNLPSNPIDLEQREGRINRFKGLVIRQQIAHKYGPLLIEAAL